MTHYDLREYHSLPWVRRSRWFRLTFLAVLIVITAWIAYGVPEQVESRGLGFLLILGDALIFFVLGAFLLMMAIMRSPAVGLSIDDGAVRLEFEHGAADVRPWTSGRTKFRGRYTRGAPDNVSLGRPLWSIYGRLGPTTETFIPESAFSELVSTSKIHGFDLSTTAGRPGWTLYALVKH